MRKRKLFFGARRRWPDSPYLQLTQHRQHLEQLHAIDSESYRLLYEKVQTMEVDLLKGLSKMAMPIDQLQSGKHRGGLRRGEFYTTAGYNPNPQMMPAHRLQAMLNNGLQGKIMICLEDSYTHPHFVPIEDFDNLCRDVDTPEMRRMRLQVQAHAWTGFERRAPPEAYLTKERPDHVFDPILMETPDVDVRTPDR